jgi:hypothetical protein
VVKIQKLWHKKSDAEAPLLNLFVVGLRNCIQQLK